MKLAVHELRDLRNIDIMVYGEFDESSLGYRISVEPGDIVYHRDDRSSFGLCLSVRVENTFKVCDVMWTLAPFTFVSKKGIVTQEIKAQSRKLNVKWDPQSLSEPGMLKW